MSAEEIPAALEVDYEILRELGRGGTAVVYLARQRSTGAEVAIKLVRSKYLEDDEALARFAREARFAAQLEHPNIVPMHAVLDLGSAGIALVMGHVSGRTLKQLIHDEKPLSIERVESVFRDIAGALAAAHELGIVHRDVKPENIFVDDEGHALLADFGVARSMSGDTQLTMSGVAIGTPAYMAPEQIDGVELDGRGDIYSLGLVAWQMLTGLRPWDGESLYAVLYHQKHEYLPDVREMRPDVPDRIAEVIAVAIEKERDARWKNVAEMVAALDNPGPVRRPVVPVPVSTETVRVMRVATPPRVEMTVDPFESLLTELANDQAVFAPPPRRRFLYAGGALLGVALLAVIGTAMRVRANDASRFAESPTLPVSASGDLVKSTTTAAAPAPAPSVVPAADTTKQPVADTPRSIPVAMPPKGVAASKLEVRLAAEPVKSSPSPSTPPSTTNGGATTPNAATTTQPAAKSSAQPPAASNSSATDAASAPSLVTPPTSRVNIAAGGVHSCLVGADGRAFCWGGNERGQLGNAANTRVSAPAPVGGDLRFSSVASGLSHSCGIVRGGAAWCWGDNGHGQLGDRSDTTRFAPVRVADGHTFRSIAAGASSSCGLDSSGAAWCWGANSYGQLGDGGTNDHASPMPVVGGKHYASLSLGWNFVCALDADGRASCWGNNSAGQLGDNTDVDRRVPGPVHTELTFIAVTAGSAHACGVTTRGDAYCWGKNTNGQLGDGTTTDRFTPVKVKSGVRFVAIAAGAVHTCAIAAGGDAYCWGRNTYGQLGDGSTTDHNEPVRVLGTHAFASIRAFGSHTCGATVSGEAFCWGYNLDGQLGDGSRTHRTRPVYVEPPAGV
ncbi:MAG TPA: protein kinase [Gemmatimonadaceae bacterium]|nr:protein kinase [Gemmatimonadaceae bacterium]